MSLITLLFRRLIKAQPITISKKKNLIYKMNICVWLISDRQSFTSCKSCGTSERVKAANIWDDRTGNSSIGNRRNNGNLRRGRRLQRRRKTDIQSVVMLRGSVGPNPGANRNSEIFAAENSESWNLHTGRKNSERSCCCWW